MLSFACCAASPIWIVLPSFSRACGIRKSYTLEHTPESSPQLQPLRPVERAVELSSSRSPGCIVGNMRVTSVRAARRKLMKLFKKPKSKFYWCDFTVRGHRYRASTQETKSVRALQV